jgi:adenosine kinase
MIIVTGSLAYDYIMAFPGAFGDHILPEHTHNINLSFIVNKFAKHRGGTGGNVSYTMGLLKTPQILLSIAGSDFDEYRKAFEKIGINTENIAIDNSDNTATAFAMTDKVNNQIWGFYNGASKSTSSLKLNTVAKPQYLIYIGPQGVDGSMSFIKQAIELKTPFMFDPGFTLTQISNRDLEFGITHAEFVIGNEYELELISKRIKNFTNLSVGKIIITTLGSKGAVIKSKGKTFNIAPVKIDKIATTTGAGDAWRGGFLAGFARKFDLQTCGQMGSIAASFAIEHFGTQEHNYTLSEFKKRYGQTYADLLKL